MGTAGVSSAIDTRLVQVLAAMVKHVLAEPPGGAASDALATDAAPSTPPAHGPA
jgi:hypothetical protein